MFSMSLPWWEFVVRAAAVYAFLLIGFRLSGKRQIGQLAPFDLVLLLILSNAVQNSMNGGDNSLIGGIISALTLILLNHSVGFFTYRSKAMEALLEGRPLIVVHDGKIDQKIMKQEKITIHELEGAMRQAGVASVEEIRFGVIETNGAISILAK